MQTYHHERKICTLDLDTEREFTTTATAANAASQELEEEQVNNNNYDVLFSEISAGASTSSRDDDDRDDDEGDDEKKKIQKTTTTVKVLTKDSKGVLVQINQRKNENENYYYFDLSRAFFGLDTEQKRSIVEDRDQMLIGTCEDESENKKRVVGVFVAKRSGVCAFVEASERDSCEGRGYCLVKIGDGSNGIVKPTSLIVSCTSDGGVVAIIGDTNGDVFCARCDDLVSACVVDKCEREATTALMNVSGGSPSATTTTTTTQRRNDSILSSPQKAATAAARIASKITKKAGSLLFNSGSHKPVVSLKWAAEMPELKELSGMNTVSRNFFVLKEKGVIECWRCSLDSSVITPDLVSSCDINTELAARTNQFSKVLDWDYIKKYDDVIFAVFLCESVQLHKVAHVFEFKQERNLEAFKLVQSFEISSASCARILLSSNGKAIVTMDSSETKDKTAAMTTTTTCYYGAHFAKAIAAFKQKEIVSLCRSSNSLNSGSFLALADPSSGLSIWEFVPPTESEEYASPPQRTNAAPFTSPIKTRIVDFAHEQQSSQLVIEEHEKMNLDDLRSPYASVSTAYDDSARAADARFVKDSFENMNNYEAVAELAATQIIAGKETKPFAAHSAAIVDTLPKRWSGARTASGKDVRTLLEEKSITHERYTKFLVDSGAWGNTAPHEKMMVLRNGETTFALLSLRALLDTLKVEETNQRRSILSEIVEDAGREIGKADNTLSRFSDDKASVVVVSDDIFFSRSSLFSKVFWNATARVVEKKINEASQQSERPADNIRLECLNQAARVVSIALDCSNEFRRRHSDLYPAQRVSVEENWTSQASARECLRVISKFSIDVFNASRLDVGAALYTVAQPLLDASASNVLFTRTEKSLKEYKNDRMLILPALLNCARAHVLQAENVAATCESHFGYDELFTFCDAEGGKPRLFHYMRTLKAEAAAPFNENSFCFYVFQKIFWSAQNNNNNKRVSAILREIPDEFSKQLSQFLDSNTTNNNNKAKWIHAIRRGEFEKASKSLEEDDGLRYEAKIASILALRSSSQ